MRLVTFALTVVGVAVWVVFLYVRRATYAVDAHAYYVAGGSLYGGAWGANDVYVYSPAFSQILAPLRLLGLDGFVSLWRAAEAAVLIALTGPASAPLVFATPAALEILAGNVHLLIAGAIVVGFRYPAAWSLMLLTKVTPGIGLLWFAARREWRSLGIALGVTAAIAAVSFVVDPSAWFAWIGVLRSSSSSAVDPNAVALNVPLLPRLIAAAAVTVWGARGDHRWALPIAVTLAMPSVWITSLTVLAAGPFLALRGIRTGWTAPRVPRYRRTAQGSAPAARHTA